MTALAGHIGRTVPWASQMLKGRRATTFATLEQVVTFFDCDPSELFRVHESTKSDLPRPADMPESQSDTILGGGIGSRDPAGLQQRLETLETQNAALRAALAALGREYATLVRVIRPRKTAGDKSRPRGGR